MQLQIGMMRTSPQEIGAISRLEVVVDGKTLILPELCPNQDDCRRGKTWNVKAKAKILNYHHDIRGFELTDDDIEKIKLSFEKAERKYHPQLTSLSFTPERKVVLTRDDRFRMLELQKELGTTFIADTESHMDQNLERFRGELEEFWAFDTDQIKSPTISLRSEAEDDFEQKIRALVADDRYLRFNVQWGGYGDHEKNWESLLEEMSGKKKWCNMVGIVPRRTGRNKLPVRSNIPYALIHGAHTFSFGKSEHTSDEGTSFVLNGESWYYEETKNDYEEDFAISFGVAQRGLRRLRRMIGTPKLEGYLNTKPGLRIEKEL